MKIALQVTDGQVCGCPRREGAVDAETCFVCPAFRGFGGKVGPTSILCALDAGSSSGARAGGFGWLGFTAGMTRSDDL